MSREIKLSEVKKHKSSSSCWTIIDNRVYDVTKFLDEHPGGAESLLEVGGMDGTRGFEDVGHSQDAREMMKKYEIGVVPKDEQHLLYQSCPDDESWKWKLALGLVAAAALAALVYRRMKVTP